MLSSVGNATRAAAVASRYFRRVDGGKCELLLAAADPFACVGPCAVESAAHPCKPMPPTRAAASTVLRDSQSLWGRAASGHRQGQEAWILLILYGVAMLRLYCVHYRHG